MPTVTFKAKGKRVAFKARSPKGRAAKAIVSFKTKDGRTVRFKAKG